MLKKISVSQLALGMYIEKLEGSWLKHPFWKTSFKLDSEKDRQTLIKSEVSHVWIDTTKGLDITTQESTPPSEVVEKKPAIESTPPQTSFEDEVSIARKTLERAREETLQMFQDARMGQTISSADVAPLVEEISASVTRNPAAMLSLTRMKSIDEYTYMHSVAVCALMVALGKQINYQGDLQALGQAGLLHDIGKMAIPDEVLNKPGKLSDDEFALMKSHPAEGWKMLKQADDIEAVTLDVCLHHHERIDGKGYPESFTENNISIEARMGAICDVYDAITSARCYKPAWDPADAIKAMAEWQPGQFDESLFKSFVKTVGIYPAGTLLKLKSGRLAIVTEQSAQTLLKPRAVIFYSSNSHSPIPQKMVELDRSSEEIESIESPEKWGFDQQRLMQIITA